MRVSNIIRKFVHQFIQKKHHMKPKQISTLTFKIVDYPKEIYLKNQGKKPLPKYCGPVLDKPADRVQGRNEFCSCGSGKKSKKCCGK